MFSIAAVYNGLQFHVRQRANAQVFAGMPTTAEISAKANDERERCRVWLRKFMTNGKPKMATKEELWAVASLELGVSRSSFDFGWGMAIIDTGREDWFEPLRKRLRKNPQ